VSWSVILSRQAVKDTKKIKQAGLTKRVKLLLKVLEEDPYANPPRYEILVGNLKGLFSRRINIQHRLIYSVNLPKRSIHILRMWTHYE